MAFGNLTTLYIPTAANAGTSQWGTDVRKVLDSADAGSDTTTIANFGTGSTAVTRTFDPYSSSSADSDQTLFGWAVTPSDMNSVAGALRYFPPGDHVANLSLTHSSISAQSATLYMFVYRVGTAGTSRARTLLGSNSASISVQGSLSGPTAYSVTVNLAEVTFEADETVQYSFELNMPGIVITGRTVNFNTGTPSSGVVSITTPGLKTRADTTGSVTASGTATGSGAKVLGTVGQSSGSGVVTGLMSARADMVGSAAGAGSVSGLMSAVAGTVGTSAGIGTATGVLTGIGSMTGAAAGQSSVTGVLGATGGMVGSAAGTGVATGVLGATASMTGAATGVATVAGLASSVAGAVGSSAGTSAATGLASIVLGTVGTVEIGAPTSGTPDWPATSPTRQVAGVVYHHETGAVVVGATVRLYRDTDHLLVRTDTSSVVGAYSFLRDAADPYTYFVTADYNDAGTPIQGKSTTAAPTTI